ncbi:hypothetical protein SO694_0008707 [Aureococcus anophagefferens]|uniref:Uncharacterized protein n=1 Tax=Aureococcus anophagefferens TaxID=44056 RepID=A0ABR1G452_AURAN|nr:hypothetical protein JL721_3219 [Aureococcus anophagefferens]
MPKGQGYYGPYLKMSSPSNPVATFHSSSRPFTAPSSPGKAVFPEFAAVGARTQRTGPSWATGLATDRPNTREKLRSLAPTSQPAHLRTRPICKSAQRGTLILPESICRGVGYKPKPSARPRGDLYSHHPHWVAGV